ncbi:MAG: DNA polymerase III subunit beta, partial [Myxococcota bacterium]|nr:DNA polymerase III subunit beta [Myxococcota bacterium]
DQLSVTATDGQLTLIDQIEATIYTEGSICVKAYRFFQIIRSLNSETTNLKFHKQRLNVKGGQAKFNIAECKNPDEFPPYKPVSTSINISLPNLSLKRLLNETVFSIIDQERTNLNGAHIEIVDEGELPSLRMVTTDGNRLSLSESKFDGDYASLDQLIQKMLLPKKALQELLKLCANYGEQEWSISFGQQETEFAIEDLKLSFSLVDGQFPNYKTVFERLTAERRAKVNRKKLSNIFRRVGIFQTKTNSSVKFSFESDGLELTMNNVELGDFRESIDVDFEGSPFSISFNINYFQDILTAVESEYLLLELKDPMNPCVVKIPNRDDCKFVIMPMRHN